MRSNNWNMMVFIWIFFFIASRFFWIQFDSVLQHQPVQSPVPCIRETLSESNANERMINQTVHWRRLAGELSCKVGNIGPTGGWCLQEDENNWGELGKSAAHHVVADSGIAATVSKYLIGQSGGKPVSLLDICAGVGQYGHWFTANSKHQIQWSGYDGAENVESFTDGFVRWIDVTSPVFDTIPFVSDWVMSLECGEHIPHEFTDTFIDLLDKHNKQGVILSWSVPNQGGFNHINEQLNKDIIQRLLSKGYIRNEWSLEFEREGRQAAVYSWFKATFMVFKRETVNTHFA
jgi:hypothetical protein